MERLGVGEPMLRETEGVSIPPYIAMVLINTRGKSLLFVISVDVQVFPALLFIYRSSFFRGNRRSKEKKDVME